MKFKVGDKVRLTRNAIEESVRKNWCVNYSAVIGWEVIRTDETQSFVNTNEKGYPLLNQDLEFIPEKSEFKFGDIIEVSNDTECWRRAPFIAMSLEDREKKYIVAALLRWPQPAYDKVSFVSYKYARKIKPRLTRKEIAERFWVNEDFELIED